MTQLVLYHNLLHTRLVCLASVYYNSTWHNSTIPGFLQVPVQWIQIPRNGIWLVSRQDLWIVNHKYELKWALLGYLHMVSLSLRKKTNLI